MFGYTKLHMSSAGTTGLHVEVGALIAWPFMDPSLPLCPHFDPSDPAVSGYPTLTELEEETLS